MRPPHPELLTFDEIPTHRDVLVLSERQLDLHDAQWAEYLTEPDGSTPPSPDRSIDFRTCSIEALRADACEVNLCIDQAHRYHGAVRTLPRANFVKCVRYWKYQRRPYLFVSDNWFQEIESLHYSLYALVDVIGMRDLIGREGRIERGSVDALRHGIDVIADAHPDHVFLTFADNVLVKTNWSASRAEYGATYRPERFLDVVAQVIGVFKDALKLPAYAVVTQGSNQLAEEGLFHISGGNNHIFFGSLGTPFAELFEIDSAARAAIRNQSHTRGSLYLSQSFFLTLRFDEYDRRNQLLDASYPFESKMVVPQFRKYHVLELEEVRGQIVEPGLVVKQPA